MVASADLQLFGQYTKRAVGGDEMNMVDPFVRFQKQQQFAGQYGPARARHRDGKGLQGLRWLWHGFLESQHAGKDRIHVGELALQVEGAGQLFRQ